MSKLTRVITIGAILAAMSLPGTTAVAQAQSSDRPTSPQDARRPPTEAQVGESWHERESVPVRSADPSGYPGWLLASLSMLAAAAAVALAGGLAVLAARRAGRKARAGQAA